MFALQERKIGGFKFGQKTWYTAHHLGVDYVAKSGTKLYAPFDGQIQKEFTGTQGGLTIWFKPNNADMVMRFMHLSKFVAKAGKVKEGDVIGLTGNTGSATTGAHLHLDISKKNVQISNFSNFLDPEKYQWEFDKNIIGEKINTMNKIEDWANAAKKHEGWYLGSASYRNNNPGNFRCSALVMGELGATKCVNNLAVFPNYETGFNALKTFLTYACTDQLRSYKSTMTLLDFYKVYAPSSDNNNPLNYATIIAQDLGVTVNTKIGELYKEMTQENAPGFPVMEEPHQGPPEPQNPPINDSGVSESFPVVQTPNQNALQRVLLEIWIEIKKYLNFLKNN
jgi:murein DD-endopeptidase MepM/ murein hydrolase activator NlpD